MAYSNWSSNSLSEAERKALEEIDKRNGRKRRPAATEFESNHSEFFEEVKPKPTQK